MAQHSVEMEDREKVQVEGVRNILSFDEEAVVLDTTLGQLHVYGEGLHVTTLNLNDSEVALQGKIINGLEYKELLSEQVKARGQGLLRRILK